MTNSKSTRAIKRYMLALAVIVAVALVGIISLEAQASPATWTVQTGDTLFTIAKATGVSIGDLIAWNSITDAANLQPGQELRLDPPAPLPAQAPVNNSTPASPQQNPSQQNPSQATTAAPSGQTGNSGAVGGNLGNTAKSALSKASDALANLTKKGGALDTVLNLFQKKDGKSADSSITGSASGSTAGGTTTPGSSATGATAPTGSENQTPAATASGSQVTGTPAPGASVIGTAGEQAGQPQAKSWGDTVLGWAKSYGWIAILGLLKIVGII